MGRMTAAERFAASYVREGECWRWTRQMDQKGYGLFVVAGVRWKAHRLAYELLVGPIPEGRQLDHLCRNHWCVNPAHLEPVDNRENFLRGTSPAAQAVRRGTCKRGHGPENFHRYPDGRLSHCRACVRVLRAEGRWDPRSRTNRARGVGYRPKRLATTSAIAAGFAPTRP